MPIVLARVDDRLIHGQVVEGWVPYVSADIIIIANNNVCRDESRCHLMRMIVPEELDLHFISLDGLGTLLEQKNNSKIMLLFETLEDVDNVRAMGVTLSRVNLGNLHHLRGGIEVAPSVFLNRDDMIVLRNLLDQGVRFDVQEVPNGKCCDLLDVLGGSCEVT